VIAQRDIDEYLGGIAIQDHAMNLPHCRMFPESCEVFKPGPLEPCDFAAMLCGRPPIWLKSIVVQPVIPNFNRHFSRPLQQVAPVVATYKPLRDVLPLLSKSSSAAGSLSIFRPLPPGRPT
jgi:hypothetical protein